MNFLGLDTMALASVAFFCTIAAVCGITLGRIAESRVIVVISVIFGVFGSMAMLVLLRKVLPPWS